MSQETKKPVASLSNLKPSPGSRKGTRRLGRGMGSGRGRTSGRGHKGHKSRSGGGANLGFEGGQMPLIRRLPKRGFFNPFRKHWSLVNLRELKRFPSGAEVGPEELRKSGLVKGRAEGIKILGKGELPHPLTIRADAFSAGAKTKITAAGGQAIELGAGKKPSGGKKAPAAQPSGTSTPG